MVAAFKERLQQINPAFTTFESLQTLQVNLGNLCNLCCTHCHVQASPSGKQVMGKEVIDQIIGFLNRHPDITLDLTGGCPELNPNFRYLIEATDDVPRRIVRSNLTILLEPGMEWLQEFFCEHDLVITASLPCYQKDNVDRQRGDGVHGRSIAALKKLNAMGYGTSRELNLVYNPAADFIPGSQKELESAYKAELFECYGIIFNNLYTIANAPIGRFRTHLEEKGRYERYLNLLATSFNPNTAAKIMCRTLVSVDWKGFLFNCDFNQAIGLPMTDQTGRILKIDDLDKTTINGTELFLAQHCYCCTAGEGSSCTGALAK